MQRNENTGMSKALGWRAQIMESNSGARSRIETNQCSLEQRVVTLVHRATMESIKNLESADEP